MSEVNAFADLLRRVRAGDAAAAEELVRSYEPHIHRAVRLHLRDAWLRRALDSTDVCQSVLASFFLRAASGQYELERPEQLARLLMTIARNKIATQARRPQVVRREEYDFTEAGGEQRGAAAREASPSEYVAGKDLLEEVRRRLTREERHLVEQRVLGRGWEAIAAELGADPEAVRKKHARALSRVARQLGVD